MVATGKGKAGCTIAKFMFNKKRKLSECAKEVVDKSITEVTALKAVVSKLTEKVEA